MHGIRESFLALECFVCLQATGTKGDPGCLQGIRDGGLTLEGFVYLHALCTNNDPGRCRASVMAA